MLAFATFTNDSDCDSDSDNDDDEFIDEQRAEFFDNLVVEHERLVKSYMKNHEVLYAHKNKIDVKIRFLESEHHSLLEKNNDLTQEIKNNKLFSYVNEFFHPRTKVLNEILDKCKTHGDKRGWGDKRYVLVIVDDFSRYSFMKSIGDNIKDLETIIDNPNGILQRDIDLNNDEIIPLDDTPEEIRDKNKSKIPKNHSNVITFAPIISLELIRILLEIAYFLRIKLYQMDVKSAFLNGILSEEVYVEQPKGFEDPKFPTHVYRLNKALYRLKSNNELLVTQIYVDDIVFGATFSDLALSFEKEMKIEFEMSTIGELTFFLGLQIRQLKDEIFFYQSKYARKVVKKFGLEYSKHSSTPMSTATKLSKDASRKDVKQKLYRSMIGNLLYLIASRPDISFSVGACARYQENPKESHLMYVKRIIPYINRTLD
ncbi:hypothetical protein AAG906_003372 [Vitis piasezkii]